jgi:two-component system, OmpR family, sensor histidine kinase VicK
LYQYTKRNYKLVCTSKHGLPGTIVLTDGDKIVEAIRQFQANTRTFWGACVDSSLPEFSVGKVRQGYVDAKGRGVRILYITEITKDNLRHCREIMQFAELRHLDGVMGNFAVSDTEYVAGVKRGSTLVSLVHSDVIELVMQQRHVFDTLWQQAAPAKEKLERL